VGPAPLNVEIGADCCAACCALTSLEGGLMRSLDGPQMLDLGTDRTKKVVSLREL